MLKDAARLSTAELETELDRKELNELENSFEYDRRNNWELALELAAKLSWKLAGFFDSRAKLLDEAVKILFDEDKPLNADDRLTFDCVLSELEAVDELDKLELKLEELVSFDNWELALALGFELNWELAGFFEPLVKLLDDADESVCDNKPLKADDRLTFDCALSKLEVVDELDKLELKFEELVSFGNWELSLALVFELNWELAGFFEPLVKLLDDADESVCDNKSLKADDRLTFDCALSELETVEELVKLELKLEELIIFDNWEPALVSKLS
ncbi:hypothetical protein PT285_09745 [Lactobacillus sp. ESL0791]|uniref:hypothetical protein n=1 Tax=Lactobacillus sp. ESL0791 TaxID=2983234 RepID=UPI0023F8C5AF|nr:hypothetical protein [Lactobacillus sp. ESL0791]MDF7639682.1 hypothetical protein [Lactobacillus sp. ESL0791]